jgi:hypothetical protein
MSRGARCPDEPPTQAIPYALHSEWPHTDPAGPIAGARPPARSLSPDNAVWKRELAWLDGQIAELAP